MSSTDKTEAMNACYKTFGAWNFSYHQIKLWLIWGAKASSCPVCGQPAYLPCLNMMYLKRDGDSKVTTKRPHEPRIDWDRIREGLIFRHYMNKDSTYGPQVSP